MDNTYQQHMQLPHAHESVLNSIRASFIGPEGHADYLKALGLDDGPLRCDLDKMMEWLEVLKAVHTGYKDVDLRARTDENRRLFSTMPGKIIDAAQYVFNETCRAMEDRLGADVANVRKDTHDEGVAPELPMEEDGCVVDLNDPGAMQKLNVYFQTCAVLDAVESDDTRACSVLDQLCSLVDGSKPIEDEHENAHDSGTEWEPGTLEARREADPVSEYDESTLDRLLA
jgi:hypothetical protein